MAIAKNYGVSWSSEMGASMKGWYATHEERMAAIEKAGLTVFSLMERGEALNAAPAASAEVKAEVKSEVKADVLTEVKEFLKKAVKGSLWTLGDAKIAVSGRTQTSGGLTDTVDFRYLTGDKRGSKGNIDELFFFHNAKFFAPAEEKAEKTDKTTKTTKTDKQKKTAEADESDKQQRLDDAVVGFIKTVEVGSCWGMNGRELKVTEVAEDTVRYTYLNSGVSWKKGDKATVNHTYFYGNAEPSKAHAAQKARVKRVEDKVEEKKAAAKADATAPKAEVKPKTQTTKKKAAASNPDASEVNVELRTFTGMLVGKYVAKYDAETQAYVIEVKASFGAKHNGNKLEFDAQTLRQRNAAPGKERYANKITLVS